MQADGLLHARLMAMIAAGDWGDLNLLPAVGVPVYRSTAVLMTIMPGQDSLKDLSYRAAQKVAYAASQDRKVQTS